MAGSAHYPKQNEAVWADLNFSSGGDNTIVAGVANNTITIVKLAVGVISTQSALVTLWDGPSSSGTAKGSYFLGSVVLDLETDPIIISAGNSFIINLTAEPLSPPTTATVRGAIAYIQGTIAG